MALPSRGSTQRWATSHCTASWKILRLFEFQASKLLGFHSPKAPCHMTLKPRLWAAHVLLPAPVERQERCCRHGNFKGFSNSCSKSPSQFENSNISSSLSQPEFCFRRFAASLAAAIGGLWLWHAILARQLDSSLITSCPTCFFYANRGNNLQSFRGRTWQLVHGILDLFLSMQSMPIRHMRFQLQSGSLEAFAGLPLSLREGSAETAGPHIVRYGRQLKHLTMHAELLVQMVLPRHRLHCKLQTPCRLVGTRRSLCVGFLQSAQWTEGRPVEVSLDPLVAIVTPKFPQSSNWISVWKATLRRQLLDVRIYWCCWRTDSGPWISSLFKTGTVDWTPTEQMFQDMSRI